MDQAHGDHAMSDFLPSIGRTRKCHVIRTETRGAACPLLPEGTIDVDVCAWRVEPLQVGKNPSFNLFAFLTRIEHAA